MIGKRVVGLGFCPLDEIIVVETYPTIGMKVSSAFATRFGGGAVATGLVLLSALGIQTQFISTVGNDEDGKFLLDALQQKGVNCNLVRQVAGEATYRTVIIVDASNHKATVITPKVSPVNDTLYSNPNILEGASILHLDGYYLDDALELARFAKQQAVLVSINVGRKRQGMEKLLSLADILVTSRSFALEESACSSPEVALNYLRKKYPLRIIAITLQDKGAICWSKDCGVIKTDGISVGVIDDSSAGDIFHGAFLFGILNEWPMQKTVMFSNATAAYSCQFYGGREGIPDCEGAVWDFLPKITVHCPDDYSH